MICSKEEISRVCSLAMEFVGAPYIWGAKPKFNEDPRSTGTDCSGFSRFIIGQLVQLDGRRILLPHGAQEQLAFCKPVGGTPRPLDLGFGDMDLDPKDKRPIDHVIIRLTDTLVIEARGQQKGRDYGKVITRPVSAWEKWPGFWGWWRAPGLYADKI
mgnify:CR=1 FL=1